MDCPGPPRQDAGDDAEHPGDRVDVVLPPRSVPEGSDGGGVGTHDHLHALDPLPVGSELQFVVVQTLVVLVDPSTELLELRVEVGPQGVEPGVESLEFGQNGLALSGSRDRPEVVETGTEPGDVLRELGEIALTHGSRPVGPGDARRLAAELAGVVAEGCDLAVEVFEPLVDLVGVHDISFPHKGSVTMLRISQRRLSLMVLGAAPE